MNKKQTELSVVSRQTRFILNKNLVDQHSRITEAFSTINILTSQPLSSHKQEILLEQT
jgi:hypothetical protein